MPVTVADGGRPARNPRAEAFVTGAAYAALAVLGAVVGVVESFSFAWSMGSFPVAAVLICLVNLVLLRLAGWGMGGKLGAATPAATWLIALMVFSVRTPSGGLVVTGTTAGNLYLLGGTVAGLLAIVLTPSSHNWLLAGAGDQSHRM